MLKNYFLLSILAKFRKSAHMRYFDVNKISTTTLQLIVLLIMVTGSLNLASDSLYQEDELSVVDKLLSPTTDPSYIALDTPSYDADNSNRVDSNKDKRLYLDVQSSSFLNMFAAPVSPIYAKSGSTVLLWSKMLIFEDADFDPLQHLNKVSTHWSQVSGPAVRLEDADAKTAVVFLPEVNIPLTIELRCLLSNQSGKKSLLLTIRVIP